MADIIVLKDVCKEFSGRKVIDGFNLSIAHKDSLVIMGNSGSGKSVLAKMMIGIMQPESGSIRVNDKKLTTNLRRNVVSNDISFCFQSDALLDSLKVKDNLAIALIKRRNMKKKVAIAIAISELKNIGLDEDVAEFYPNELSGGMRKRVAVLRSLIIKPKIAIFDEPTTGLDPITNDKISKLIKHYINKYEITAVTITHNAKCMYEVGHRVLFLIDGQLLWQGDINSLPSVQEPKIQMFLS
ncbi:ATP-binding cassette domain-containing protein [Anaplasmataceae bacterium AB001_6]|nr:ATP-binding cassette domain-containing protein [Anaplasmataceae bacterium AB001_6]